MTDFRTSRPRQYTAFPAVAGEAPARFGYMHRGTGRLEYKRPDTGYILIVETADSAAPYKMIFHRCDGSESEKRCRTVGECQSLINLNSIRGWDYGVAL